MVSCGISRSSPLSDGSGSKSEHGEKDASEEGCGNKVQTRSGMNRKIGATARGTKLETSTASLFRHPAHSIVAAQEQRLRQINALDLCDVKASTSFRCTRSSNVVKDTTQRVSRDLEKDNLTRNEEQELLAKNHFQKDHFPKTGTPSTSAGVSCADENSDPFTSDEEEESLRKDAACLSKRGKQTVKDWPDTDDEFERSCPLNYGDTFDTDDSDGEGFSHDTDVTTRTPAAAASICTHTLVGVVHSTPPCRMWPRQQNARYFHLLACKNHFS